MNTNQTLGQVNPTAQQPEISPNDLTEEEKRVNNMNETSDTQVAPVNDSSEEKPEPEEILSMLTLNQVLKINTQVIDFGNVFPGQIIEETLIILNNLSNTKVPFKIKVNCLTKEFDELDEYVYSMRRPSPNDVFNYNDTFLILLAQKAISYYKLAIKVPFYREEAEILGNVEISSTECAGENLVVPIKSRIVFPNIKCEKLITIKSLKMSLIKLYMKTPKRQDFRIVVKNICKMNCVAEPSILKNDSDIGFMEFGFYPPQVTLNSGVPANFNMSVKCNLSEAEVANREIRGVIVIKVRNSSVMFAFPMIIIMGDGKSTDSTS
jgi:hypothetical protein